MSIVSDNLLQQTVQDPITTHNDLKAICYLGCHTYIGSLTLFTPYIKGLTLPLIENTTIHMLKTKDACSLSTQ